MPTTLADIGLPMIVYYWPPVWVAIFPIILVEAWMAVRILQVNFKYAIGHVALANIISTLIGIPLAWMILAVIEGIFFGGAQGLSTAGTKLYAVTIQSPWLIPYREAFWWMKPCAVVVLTVIFYLLSVVVEWLIMRVTCSHRGGLLMRWSLWANAASYAGLLVLVIVFLYFPQLAWSLAPVSFLPARAVFWIAGKLTGQG